MNIEVVALAGAVLFFLLLLAVLLLRKRTSRKARERQTEGHAHARRPTYSQDEQTGQNLDRQQLAREQPTVPAREPEELFASTIKAAEPAGITCLPQDSVLRRHYMTHVYSMIQAVTFPAPTDSILRRHYNQHLVTTLEACVRDKVRMDQLLKDYQRHKENTSRPTSLAAPFTKISPAQGPKPAAQPTPLREVAIPEDSVQRRHYLTHLHSIVQALSFPRPTDSVLRRHYEQFIAGKLSSCLSDSAQLNELIRNYENRKGKLA